MQGLRRKKPQRRPRPGCSPGPVSPRRRLQPSPAYPVPPLVPSFACSQRGSCKQQPAGSAVPSATFLPTKRAELATPLSLTELLGASFTPADLVDFSNNGYSCVTDALPLLDYTLDELENKAGLSATLAAAFQSLAYADTTVFTTWLLRMADPDIDNLTAPVIALTVSLAAAGINNLAAALRLWHVLLVTMDSRGLEPQPRALLMALPPKDDRLGDIFSRRLTFLNGGRP